MKTTHLLIVSVLALVTACAPPYKKPCEIPPVPLTVTKTRQIELINTEGLVVARGSIDLPAQKTLPQKFTGKFSLKAAGKGVYPEAESADANFGSDRTYVATLYEIG